MKIPFTLGLLALTTVAVNAASPWTEADGENVVFSAHNTVICSDGWAYTAWIPFDTAAQKQLNFLRVTSNQEGPFTGITMERDDVFLNGERCTDQPCWLADPAINTLRCYLATHPRKR